MRRSGVLNGLRRWAFDGVLTLAAVGWPLVSGAQQETASRVERAAIEAVSSPLGMVVSETPLASAVGAAVLEDGGSAVDAAVAVGFALAVTWPEAGNIAGGGFMMVAEPGDAEVVCIDYRETAPGAATPTMFAEKRTRFWHGQVGVPGTVRGLAMAHERWGRLPWARLIEPSVELAREGFVVNDALARSLNEVLNKRIVRRDPQRFAELIRVYGKPDGEPWAAGDRLVLSDLARTLQHLAEGGADTFYEGSVAAAIAQDMAEHGGLITEADLAGYRAIARPAIHARFQGYDVFGPPPPSAGGLTLAMMLHQLDTFDLTEHGRYSATTLHRMAEAMRRAYFWRARTLGDADFIDVPFEIGGPAFGQLLATTIDPGQATPSHTLEPAIPLADREPHESPDTTHYSVIDADGLAVSNTYTLEMSWGSRMITKGHGIVLNNEMGDFNRAPGVTKTTGQIGTLANLIAPGKRMLSSQTPTLVKKDGRVVLITGSPGGRTITNTVLNVLVSHLAYGMPLTDAVDGPRLHHQWFPDVLEFEGTDAPAHADAVQQLRAMGHDVKDDGRQGSANSIAIDPETGVFLGVPDWRRGANAHAPQTNATPQKAETTP
ncbi:MAG: gamma-glutamyltransferase [Planctomycetota bacterium]